jgi:hypothetical protein
MTFNPPEKDKMVMSVPPGYVFPTDRTYPFAPVSGRYRIDTFNDYADRFTESFQPHIILNDINIVDAVLVGVQLHQKGYKMVQGALVGAGSLHRTVADVLHGDFDCTNKQIVDYLEGGALVASYILFDTPDKKPFYGTGVGLWMGPEQLDNLANHSTQL